MDFTEASQQYVQLCAALTSGQISEAQFRGAVAALRVQDGAGRWWGVDPQTGQWLYFDGAAWRPAAVPSAAPPAPPAPVPAPPRRAARPRISPALIVVPLGLVGVLIVLSLSLAAPSGRWDLLPCMLLSTLTNGPSGRLRPARPVRSGTAALKIEPAPGLHVYAPRNALDKPRTFKAERLTGGALDRAAERTGGRSAVPVAAYRLDCGMSGAEVFPGEVTLGVDLKALGVPKALWQSAGLVHLADDGTVSLLPSSLRGPQVTAGVRHNGVIVLRVVFFWLPLIAGVFTAWDRQDVPTGDFLEQPWPPRAPRVVLHWPRTLAHRNPGAITEAVTLFLDALRRHPPPERGAAPIRGLPPNPSLRDVAQAMEEAQAILQRVSVRAGSGGGRGDYAIREDYSQWHATLEADADYAEYTRRIADPTWLLENYLPVKVGHAVRALDVASDYLRKRNIRAPGVSGTPLVADLFFLDIGGNAYGEVINPYTKSPYMVVDISKITPWDAHYFLKGVPAPTGHLSRAPGPTATANARENFDDLQLTLLHESFHLSQGAYMLYESRDYLWFLEATAVLLENEGLRDYRSSGKIVTQKSDMLTDRTLAFVFRELNRIGASKETAELTAVSQHGYDASYFLEYLRDRYYKGSTDEFLPLLMEDFATRKGGCLSSLYHVTSGSEAGLSFAYERFVLAHAEELYKLAGSPPHQVDEGQVDALATFDFWTFRPYRPLSATFGLVRTPNAVIRYRKAEDRPVHAVAMNGLGEMGVRFWKAPESGGPWTPLPPRGGRLPDAAAHRLLRIEEYITVPPALTQTSEAGLDGQGPVVFGMYKQPAPTIRVNGDQLVISHPLSSNARLMSSTGKPVVISDYRYILHLPNGRVMRFGAEAAAEIEFPVKTARDLLLAARHKTLAKFREANSETEEGRNNLGPLAEIADAFTPAASDKVAFGYCEVAAGSGLEGPESAVASVVVDDAAASVFDISGQWAGKVPCSGGELLRLEIVPTPRHNFRGTLHLGGEDIPVWGTPQAGGKAWTLLIRDGKLWIPMPTLLQRLPGERLYLYAPPCLLKHTVKGPVELDWQHEEGDKRWDDFLRTLGKDIKQLEEQNGKGSK